MILQVSIPNSSISEQLYIIKYVLNNLIEIKYEINIYDKENIQIKNKDEENILTINSLFFRIVNKSWLKEESLPSLPLKVWNPKDDGINAKLVKSTIPVIYGNKGLVKNKNHWHLNLDIFGSIFFMLSRYEEAVLSDRDQHDRFPAIASVSYKEGFLNRPIVDEYVELLWTIMKMLWPDLERKKRSFKMILTHDVDKPFQYVNASPLQIAKSISGGIIKHHSIKLAQKRYYQWRSVRKGDYEKDPYYTFNFIMQESEKRGLRSAFYFIADHTAGTIDGVYTLNDPEIISLMKTIDARGHEIGLHLSYNTYLDKEQSKKEAQILYKAMQKNGIKQKLRGGRQHYLRWKTPETFQNWEYTGMEYDATLSYADMPGFRCGTCWEFPVYDLINRKPLNLIERPLIAMECSVTAERYMNKGYGEEAFKVFKSLKDACKKYNGNFVLLWHNSELVTEEQKRLYLSVLDA